MCIHIYIYRYICIHTRLHVNIYMFHHICLAIPEDVFAGMMKVMTSRISISL